MAQEVHVGAGVHLAQDPVDVEGLGVELEVEPLREHHLEDVALQDVLLGHLHRLAEGTGAHGRAHHRKGLVGVRGVDHQLGGRAGAVGRQGVDPGGGGIVGGVEVGVGGTGGDDDVVDQGHPLAPVVEHRQLTDDAEQRVGEPLVVGRDIGKVLDLAHHVVAEVTHDATVQWRQLGQGGRPVGGEDALDRRQHASVERDRRWQRALELDAPRAGHQRRQRVAAHEGETGPAHALLHRLQQEPGTVAHHPGECRHRGDQVAEDLAPHRHHRVVPGQGPELVPAGVHHDPCAVSRRRSAGRSRCGRRCGRPPGPPARRRTAGCRRRSRSRPGAPTGGRRTCRP